MRDYFHDLARHIDSLARPGEVMLSWLAGEESDFIRFNRSAVRQATAVRQVHWTLTLIARKRRLDTRVALAGNLAADRDALTALVGDLRGGIDEVPEDPFLLYDTSDATTTHESTGALPDASLVLDEVLAAGRGLDLVGLYSGGPVYRGFASTLGARHWHAVENFDFGWCLYHDRDKAVKSSYAGSSWDRADFATRMGFARDQLALLGETPRTLSPGAYRAFIAPAAMTEILGMLSWAGFGLKSRRTKQSALIRMTEQDARLSPRITLAENTREGMACGFQTEGFTRPASVALVEDGMLAAPLVSPRSAREYDVPTNGANGDEMPESLDLREGSLPRGQALAALGTGLYIGNLWYLNFSDRSACRLTGMTRFASFWVENGEIRAPLNVMRFDDTVYRLLGANLESLTAERDLIVDTDTYGARSTNSMRTPGALVNDLALTL